MEHVEYAYTTGMSEAAIEERLQTADTGVLALCADGTSRAIPLAHYYDGEGLYFRLGKTDGSEKWAALDQTETATYVVYGTEPTDDPNELESWSVHITGKPRELPDTEHERFDTAEINRRFSPIRVFDESIDDIEIAIVELDIDSMTGRATTET